MNNFIIIQNSNKRKPWEKAYRLPNESDKKNENFIAIFIAR